MKRCTERSGTSARQSRARPEPAASRAILSGSAVMPRACVQAIDELIKRFEAANPTIKVKHVNVPYDDFRLKIAAAIPAGQGPDVVQLFYGWLQDYLKAKLLQPLPADLFKATEIEQEFFPL